MPAFPWLFENQLTGEDTGAKMKALRTVGVPYEDADIEAAQAAVEGKTEAEALIAYLQQLGTLISDAGGAYGFPNLSDEDWLFGGEPDKIVQSIAAGRVGAMPPWGAVIAEEQRIEVAQYVRTLSGLEEASMMAMAWIIFFTLATYINAGWMREQREQLDDRPWYQQFWPWFLFFWPAAVVVAGVVMVTLAVRTPVSLVETEYYKEGLKINENLAATELAAALGVQAEISITDTYVRVDLNGVYADSLRLSLIHPTDAEADKEYPMRSVGARRFEVRLMPNAFAAEDSAEYRIRIEGRSDMGLWRLASGSAAERRWQENSMDRESGKFATLLNDAGDQNRVLSRILRRGERILVKTGEIFPVDAELLSVQAEISQAQLNGEFAPQSKQPGDEISSGSLNLSGPLEAMVLRATDQSVMARIRTLVENAQLHKPQISTLADQISGYFVAVVLGLGLLTYLYWAAVDPGRAFWISISVLVVSCPCALSLATPTTLTVLMNHLSNQGILVRNSKALEKLQQVDRVIFDKTGTLTFGQFCLDVTRDFSGEGIALQQQRAAALESKSPHPLANAFHNISHSFEVAAWQMIEGRGIEAKIDGQRMRIGDSAFVSELSLRASQASQGSNSTTAVADVEQGGQPSGEQEGEHKYLYLGDENRMLAAFGLRDQIRPEAGDLVRSLISQLGDKSVLVFSGDHSAQADWLGKALGVSEVYKGMSAADKLAKLDENRRQGVTVLAVGDGINDGPILAAADVSVGWTVAGDSLTRLTPASAFSIAVCLYLAQLTAIWIIGYLIHWMSQTYESDTSLVKGVVLSGFVATPLLLAGIVGVYPMLAFDMLMAIIASCYAVYLLYKGIPIALNMPAERGFLYASAVVGMILVMVITLMGATLILWDFGLEPVFQD
eukprot:g4246.t1